MNEFLRKLRASLTNEMPADRVNYYVSKYEQFFNDEIKKGKSISEIINDIGDPALIARSLIDADRISGKSNSSTNTSSNYSYNNYNTENSSRYKTNTSKEMYSEEANGFQDNLDRFKNKIKISCIVAVLAVVAVIALVVFIIISIFKMVKIIPIVLVVGLIIFFAYTASRKRR